MMILMTNQTHPLQFNANVAQLVEQLICNQQAGGSSPLGSSILKLGEVNGRVVSS